MLPKKISDTRISLGVAFLRKNISEVVSSKSIIHAEYIIQTEKFLLTKVTFTHNRSVFLNVKTVEVTCLGISDLLHKLMRVVDKRLREGYNFDSNSIEILFDVDDSWGDFELAEKLSKHKVKSVESLVSKNNVTSTLVQRRNLSSRTKLPEIALKHGSKKRP